MNNRTFNIVAILSAVSFMANIVMAIQASNYPALVGWICAVLWIVMWALHRDGGIYRSGK